MHYHNTSALEVNRRRVNRQKTYLGREVRVKSGTNSNKMKVRQDSGL